MNNRKVNDTKYDIDLFKHKPLIHALDFQYTRQLKLGLQLDSTGTKNMCVISDRSLKEYKVQNLSNLKRVAPKS